MGIPRMLGMRSKNPHHHLEQLEVRAHPGLDARSLQLDRHLPPVSMPTFSQLNLRAEPPRELLFNCDNLPVTC